MIEENVVSAAGASNSADEKMLRYLIAEAGFIPQQRDILYKHVNREPLPPQTEEYPQITQITQINGLRSSVE
jgi:2-iminoacetate synthase ThiH